MLHWPDLRHLHCKLTIILDVNLNADYLQVKTQQLVSPLGGARERQNGRTHRAVNMVHGLSPQAQYQNFPILLIQQTILFSCYFTMQNKQTESIKFKCF